MNKKTSSYKKAVYVVQGHDDPQEIKLYSNRKIMAGNFEGMSYDSLLKHNWIDPYLFEESVIQRKEIISDYPKIQETHIIGKPIEFMTDSGSIIDLRDVHQAICYLEDVAYLRNPDRTDLATNRHNSIKNIKTFYVKDYVLIMKDGSKHKVTDYIFNKTSIITRGRGRYTGLYAIKNIYKSLQPFYNEYQPKDLFHAIKFYINGTYTHDDYFIDNFKVESNIRIQS